MNDWMDAEQRVERARELFDQRKWNEALSELRHAVSINPYNSTWFFNMGLVLDEMGRFDEAAEAYREAVELDGEDAQALNHLGIDLHELGRSHEALSIFERIEKLDPYFEPAYCNRVRIYTDLGQHDKAEEMFYLARLYQEHCTVCCFNIGCSLSSRGLHERAIACWRKVLDLDDSYPQVHRRIAESLWSTGEFEQARQQFLLALRHEPGDVEALLDLGELLMDMQRMDEAGEKFRRAIEQAPEEAEAYCCYGRWLMELGRDGEAAEALRRVLQLDPTHCGTHLRLARLALRRGDRSAMRRHCRLELRLSPEVDILREMSELLLDAGVARVAAACLSRLVQEEPHNVAAWQNLAVAQFMRRRFPEGFVASERALHKDPQNVAVMHNLAVVHEQSREYDRALEWVTRALSIAPDDEQLNRFRTRLRILRWWQRLAGPVSRLFSR